MSRVTVASSGHNPIERGVFLVDERPAPEALTGVNASTTGRRERRDVGAVDKNEGRLAMALARWGFLLLVWLGIFLGAGATLAGVLAAAIPYFELINHFRPFLIISLFGLLAAAWSAGHPARAAAGLVLTANLALAAAPLAFTAGGASHPTLRITTFNVWVGNRTPEAVVEFLKSNDADVILLQEVDAALEAKLIPPLQLIYPHLVSCARRNCGLVLLSKTPWLRLALSTERNQRRLWYGRRMRTRVATAR